MTGNSPFVDSKTRPPSPRWAKVVGVFVIVVLLLVALMLTGYVRFGFDNVVIGDDRFDVPGMGGGHGGDEMDMDDGDHGSDDANDSDDDHSSGDHGGGDHNASDDDHGSGDDRGGHG